MDAKEASDEATKLKQESQDAFGLATQKTAESVAIEKEAETAVENANAITQISSNIESIQNNYDTLSSNVLSKFNELNTKISTTGNDITVIKNAVVDEMKTIYSEISSTIKNQNIDNESFKNNLQTQLDQSSAEIDKKITEFQTQIAANNATQVNNNDKLKNDIMNDIKNELNTAQTTITETLQQTLEQQLEKEISNIYKESAQFEQSINVKLNTQTEFLNNTINRFDAVDANIRNLTNDVNKENASLNTKIDSITSNFDQNNKDMLTKLEDMNKKIDSIQQAIQTKPNSNHTQTDILTQTKKKIENAKGRLNFSLKNSLFYSPLGSNVKSNGGEKKESSSNPNSETLQMLKQTNQLLEKLLFQSQSKLNT